MKKSFNLFVKNELFKSILNSKNYSYFLLGWLYNRVSIINNDNFIIKLHVASFTNYLLKLLSQNKLCKFKFKIIKKKVLLLLKLRMKI